MNSRYSERLGAGFAADSFDNGNVLANCQFEAGGSATVARVSPLRQKPPVEQTIGRWFAWSVVRSSLMIRAFSAPIQRPNPWAVESVCSLVRSVGRLRFAKSFVNCLNKFLRPLRTDHKTPWTYS